MNCWHKIANANKHRYAAAVTATNNDHIYLFGGRNSNNNYIVSEIEEYSIA